VVHREETQFDRVLRDGLPHLEAALAGAESMQKVLDGRLAFRLYDTFGIPRDFIEDMAQSRSVDFDEKGFEGAMEEQRTRARAGATFGGDRAQVDIVSGVAGIHFDPESFVGYETTSATSVVTHIFRRNDSGTTLTPVDVLNAAEEGHVVLETTPFYLEAGGQVSDTGRLFRDGAVEANVRNIERIQPGWPRMHVIAVRDGTLRVGDKVEAEVDAERRDAIRRNHTATHLLHAALRQIVGTHVKQKGSLVAPDRLRFDISHHEAVTPDQLTEIELLVNEHVFMTNQTVETEERSTEEARAAGAMALFDEKYGERVRVVTVPGFSVELCGGTHCRATGDIGPFVITHEGGVAAGVRRIEAVTGAEAVQLFQGRGDQAAGLDTLADRAVASVHTLDNLRFRRPVNASRAQKALEAVNKLAKRAKDLERENERLKVQAAMGAGTSQGDDFDVHEVLGIQVVARRVSSMDPGALRTLADSRRDRLGSGVVVMACDTGGKATLVASVTPDVADRVPAGKLVKELAPIVGGRGGGRPDFAQAGGREVDRINSIVPQCYTAITRMLDEDS
jgi:alanyl-tRNA synthetase